MKKLLSYLTTVALLVLSSCLHPNQVNVQKLPRIKYMGADAMPACRVSFKGTKPAEGDHVFVLFLPSGAEILGSDARYPKKDTSWYEGSTLFEVSECEIL